MAGWKCVIFRAQPRPVPYFFGFNRWAGAAGCNFNRAPDDSRKCERDEHGEENARPSLITPPPGDPGKNKPKHEMLRPIAELAYVLHEIVDHTILMVRDEVARRKPQLYDLVFSGLTVDLLEGRA